MRVGYKRLIETVLDDGDKVSPRGQDTREILGFTLRVEDPTNNVLTGVRKGYNRGIAAAEAAQLVAGVSDPALMVRISKNFARFLDTGSFHGAYGPRIKTQLPEVARRLADDNSTRQAIVQIWRPQDDLWGTTVDLPCTLGFQFFIRNDKLIMQSRMRSNDVNWGVPYDVFQFTQLQLTMANVLGLEVGEFIHTVGSMHIYEKDIDALLDVEEHDDEVQAPLGFAAELDDVDFLGPEVAMKAAMKEARTIVDGSLEYSSNAELAWYNESLLMYRA
jgi:thymidylate synthase